MATKDVSKTPLFDLQVNGFAGVDFQRADLSGPRLRDACEALRRFRTHRMFLTLITDGIEDLTEKLRRIEAFRAEDALIRETVVGYHLEGPYLNSAPGYCGAHPPEFMKDPDIDEFHRLQEAAGGNIRLFTIAPELPGSVDFIRRVTSGDVRVSIGHANPSMDEIDAAIDAGATLCTHLGNGCPAELARHDNVIQRLLSRDELIACFIPDGIHIPFFALKNYLRSKPEGKSILTTDCMAAAGSPPGRYTIGRIELEVGADRVVRQPGRSNFAGSSLTPDEGVANVVAQTGIDLEKATAMTSTVVAEHFGIELPSAEN